MGDLIDSAAQMRRDRLVWYQHKQQLAMELDAFCTLYRVSRIRDPSVTAIKRFAMSGGADKKTANDILLKHHLIWGDSPYYGCVGAGRCNALLDHSYFFGKKRGEPTILLSFPYDRIPLTPEAQAVADDFEKILNLRVHVGVIPPLWDPGAVSIIITTTAKFALDN